MLPYVIRTRIAFPIPIETRQRVGAAGLQRGPKNILNHVSLAYLEALLNGRAELRYSRLSMRARTVSKTTIAVLALALVASAAPLVHAEDRAAWMKQAKWGVMNHYLADLQGKAPNLTMSVDEWNKLIDNFDTEALAEQLHSVGAYYYQISIGQTFRQILFTTN